VCGALALDGLLREHVARAGEDRGRRALREQRPALEERAVHT
jgi:hypothetical protein